jgi:hypothetical protein
MTLRTHTITKKNPKHSQEWSWEETPELLTAIEQLQKSSQRVEEIKIPTLYFPNKNYAPTKRKNDKKS